MKRKLWLLLVTAVYVSNAQTDEVAFDYGKVENNIYSNSFFNFEITLPSDWVVQSKEQTENLVEAGKKIVAGDDSNLKAVIKAAEINTAYLLTLFQYEIGSAVEYNPSLMLIAENVKLAPGIKTGGDYLFQTRKLMKQSQIQYNHIDEDFENVKINGQEFHRMNLDLNHIGLHIKQSYYSTIYNNFALSIIVSHVTDDQKEDLEKVLNSLDFKK